MPLNLTWIQSKQMWLVPNLQQALWCQTSSWEEVNFEHNQSYRTQFIQINTVWHRTNMTFLKPYSCRLLTWTGNCDRRGHWHCSHIFNLFLFPLWLGCVVSHQNVSLHLWPQLKIVKFGSNLEMHQCLWVGRQNKDRARGGGVNKVKLETGSPEIWEHL